MPEAKPRTTHPHCDTCPHVAIVTDSVAYTSERTNKDGSVTKKKWTAKLTRSFIIDLVTEEIAVIMLHIAVLIIAGLLIAAGLDWLPNAHTENPFAHHPAEPAHTIPYDAPLATPGTKFVVWNYEGGR